MKKMRTAKGALEYIKATDPDTEITLNYIRCVMKSGRVPVAEVGRKTMVDVDVLIEAIASGVTIKSAATGEIRQVKA